MTIPAVQESDDLVLAVRPVGIESKKAAVLATDVAGEALQLPPVVVPDGAIATYEGVDGGNKSGRQAIGIKVVGTRGFGQELDG